MPVPYFALKDCALVTLATGKRAIQLIEFRNKLAEIEVGSIYHHFWGTLLQARFEEREYNNDFASWIRHQVHDSILAEQLAVLDPTLFDTLGDLRETMLDLVDTRMEVEPLLASTHPGEPFVFERSQIVVFDTGRHFENPEDLNAVFSEMTTGSIFYHFVDARRRTSDRRDDFSDWLAGFGEDYRDLQDSLAQVDPYFGSLAELRDDLNSLFNSHFSPEAK